MNQSKIVRLQRLMRLEEKKLDAIVIELRLADSRLNQFLQQREAIQAKLQSQFVLADSVHLIDHMRHMGAWVGRLEVDLTNTETKINDAQQQRQRCLDKIAAQRSTIKGWTILIDKMKRKEQEMEAQSVMVEADDRFLNRDNAVSGGIQ